MFVILISSISLASEDPVDEDSFRNFYLGIADYFFTAIFTFEVCLKVRGDKEISRLIFADNYNGYFLTN